jgi:hypothetical protein
MGIQVILGALLKCSYGVAPSALVVLPANAVEACMMPAATVMDNIPMMNILPFGMCQSMANPMVMAATAAALGALTPMPCIPMTTAPWDPGSPTVQIAGMKALDASSKLKCMWGGQIQISFPGQETVQIP